jgi:hypothetical protein
MDIPDFDARTEPIDYRNQVAEMCFASYSGYSPALLFHPRPSGFLLWDTMAGHFSWGQEKPSAPPPGGPPNVFL